MRFANRQLAGKELADKLSKLQYVSPIVFALPRGGVPIGYEIAQVLHAPLDIIITRKIGHPNQPEFAVCAVTEHHYVLCNETIRPYLDKDWLDYAIKKEHAEAIRRRAEYLPDPSTPSKLHGHTAILADDGVATGLSMLTAIKELIDRHPDLLIVTVPVISKEAYVTIATLVDQIHTLKVPDYFGSVGMFYEEFPQITDEEVKQMLHQ